MSSPFFLTTPLRIAALLALSAGLAQAQEVQTVKIAHAGPTSGGIAHIGKDTENGVRLAIDELNTQNLVIGGKKIKFELMAEDVKPPLWHKSCATPKLPASSVICNRAPASLPQRFMTSAVCPTSRRQPPTQT